jgi:hypothetical protein
MATMVPTSLLLSIAALLPLAQEPSRQKPPASKPAPAPAAEAKPPISNVHFDAANGWPIVADDPQRVVTPTPAPARAGAARTAPVGREVAAKGRKDAAEPTAQEAASGKQAPLASGMQMGSPLLDVFQATRAPGAFKALGGVVVWWRLTTYGAQGEQIGMREVTQIADCAFAERDRLEFADGRVYGRVGAQVFAERQGMPWPTLADAATQELRLFGMHLRLPWLFAAGNTFAVMSRDIEDRSGESFARAVLERRPPQALDILGPELDPKPRDRFELLYEPSSGLPREFVHRFAASLQTRRLLLEDWRDVEGVRMPHRRVYVDEAMRATTTLEILRIERQRVSERDFRLH